VQGRVEALASQADALDTPFPQDLLEASAAQSHPSDPGMRLEFRRQVVESAIELVQQWEHFCDKRRGGLLAIERAFEFHPALVIQEVRPLAAEQIGQFGPGWVCPPWTNCRCSLLPSATVSMLPLLVLICHSLGLYAVSARAMVC
jgi:hypothetical protein